MYNADDFAGPNLLPDTTTSKDKVRPSASLEEIKECYKAASTFALSGGRILPAGTPRRSKRDLVLDIEYHQLNQSSSIAVLPRPMWCWVASVERSCTRRLKPDFALCQTSCMGGVNVSWIDSSDLARVSGIQSHNTASVVAVKPAKRKYGPEDECARKMGVMKAVRKFVSYAVTVSSFSSNRLSSGRSCTHEIQRLCQCIRRGSVVSRLDFACIYLANDAPRCRVGHRKDEDCHDDHPATGAFVSKDAVGGV